jgi:manganese/zinc/iron transport system permease protein
MIEVDSTSLWMHFWAIATAATVSAACALVGSFLVVRRLSLLGDAISHAVLPGIVLAVLAGGRPGGAGVFLGAVIAALVTVWLTNLLGTHAGLAEDAGAGVAFTTLFAIGVVLVSALASQVDIDPGCVLYGILELVPFDTVPIFGLEMPRALLAAATVLIAIVVAAALFWKELVFTAFDPAAARAAGLPVGLVSAGLLVATSLATVASFEAVGAILVVAMLAVPAAAAELLVRRFHLMLVVAVALGVAGSVVGYLAAWQFNTNAAGMIAVVLGIEYLGAALLAPGDGVVARLVSRESLRWRVACEDRLASLWRAEEGDAAALAPRRFLDRLAQARLVVGGRIGRGAAGGLTDLGREEARVIVRSHRLWEAWLGRHVALPLDHLHPPAEWIEHHLGAEVRGRIAADLDGGEGDPHGRDIPPEGFPRRAADEPTR